MTNVVLIIVLLFLFVVLININIKKSCGSQEYFKYRAVTGKKPAVKKQTPKKPTPKKPTPRKTITSRFGDVALEECLPSLEQLHKRLSHEREELLTEINQNSIEKDKKIIEKDQQFVQTKDKLNQCRQKLNNIPIKYNPNGIPDESITKIYRIFCDKFGREGGFQIEDSMRQLSPDILIQDGQSYASNSDPTLKSKCYINPPPENQVTGDNVIRNIYSFYCDKDLVGKTEDGIKRMEWARTQTAKNLWEDAKLWATLPDYHRDGCYKDPFVENQKTGENTVKNIYNLFCEDMNNTEWGKTIELQNVWNDAQAWATLPDENHRNGCYRYNIDKDIGTI